MPKNIKTILRELNTLSGYGSVSSIIALIITIISVLYKGEVTAILAIAMFGLLLILQWISIHSLNKERKILDEKHNNKISSLNEELNSRITLLTTETNKETSTLKEEFKCELEVMNKELIRLKRKERLANGIEKLNLAFAELHQVKRDLKKIANPNSEYSIKVQHEALTKFCSHISSFFTNITNTKCAICIKALSLKQYEDSVLFTLVRDNVNSGRKHKIEKKIRHLVNCNTDFDYLFQKLGSPDGKCFFENELPLRKNYRNTSFELYSDDIRKEGLNNNLTDEKRLEIWPLPYKSTIVVPIQPLSDANKESIESIIAFLCVDSVKMNVFEADEDVNLMVGLADGIYDFLVGFLEECKKYNSAKKQDNTIPFQEIKELN